MASTRKEWYQAMVIILAAFLFAMTLKTFAEQPTIEGYSVAGEPINEEEHFTSMTALLTVIFAFFAIFILVVSKRLDYRRNT